MPFPSTTTVPRLVSAVLSAAALVLDDVLALEELLVACPLEELPPEPPQPANVSRPRAITAIQVGVLLTARPFQAWGRPGAAPDTTSTAPEDERFTGGRDVLGNRPVPARRPPGVRRVRSTRQDGGMTSPGSGSEHPQQVVVVGPDGRPVGSLPLPHGLGDDGQDGALAVGGMVEEPAKVMRIGTMIKQLLEEVRAAPLDEASRNRLRDIHAASIRELEEGLSPELREELERITLPFNEGETPSDAELRIAQAQLVGWLEGVFHGIQTALFAQQMAARAQLEEMRRRALPGGHSAAPQQPDLRPGGGQYL